MIYAFVMHVCIIDAPIMLVHMIYAFMLHVHIIYAYICSWRR